MNQPYHFTPQPFAVRLHTRPTYWHCEPGWEWMSPPLADHLLWYVMEGVGVARLSGRSWDLRAGVCFVFAPGDRPHCTQDPDQRLVVFGMHFDMVGPLGEPLAHSAGLRPPPGLMVRDVAMFATLAQRCDATYRRGGALGEAQSQLFLQAMLLQLWSEVLYPPQSAIDRAIDEVVQLILREPGVRRTVAELAQRTHLSPSQFVRRFRAVAGAPPGSFMIQARLERARQMLLETSMSIGQIASTLGYDDVTFFSRQFRKAFGVPPTAMRDQ